MLTPIMILHEYKKCSAHNTAIITPLDRPCCTNEPAPVLTEHLNEGACSLQPAACCEPASDKVLLSPQARSCSPLLAELCDVHGQAPLRSQGNAPAKLEGEMQDDLAKSHMLGTVVAQWMRQVALGRLVDNSQTYYEEMQSHDRHPGVQTMPHHNSAENPSH